MTVSARLSRAFHQTFGEEPADDLVNWMGQMESSRSELREMMDLYQQRTDAKFDAVESRLTARMDAGFARMEVQFAKLDGRFEQVDAKIERKFAEAIKWSFVFWAGTMGTVVAIIKLLQ